LYKCCGLLKLIGGVVLLGATLGLIGAVAYELTNFLKETIQKKLNQNHLMLCMDILSLIRRKEFR